MSNSNINRIEPIAPLPSYSKYSCRGKLDECLFGKSTETEEFTKAKEKKLREIEEKKHHEELKNSYERERVIGEIRKKYGEEMVNREMDKKKELVADNKQLEECKKKIKVCGLCQKQLDPSDFYFGNTKNENTVVMVGNGKYKEDGRNVFDVRNQIILDLIEDLIKKNGLESVQESLGITVDDIYDYYTKVCKVYEDYALVDKGRSECLINLISKESLENLKKNVEEGKFLYTDIECGHKFHKKCILEWIKNEGGQVTGNKVIGRSIDPTTRIGNKRPYTDIGFKNFSAPVTCPTCNEPIRQLYYFLPTYCDKIDETGEFIRRKRDTTTKNKTKKNLTFADDRNEMRFYNKTSETNKFEYGGKRNRIRKTRSKNQKHKKTRKYKKK